MSNWIRLELEDTSCFLLRDNIAGVSINKHHPNQLSILMVGDDDATTFTFPDVKARNAKLDEILKTFPKSKEVDEILKASHSLDGQLSLNETED